MNFGTGVYNKSCQANSIVVCVYPT